MWQDGLVERRTPIARSASPPRATAKSESSLSGLLDPGSSKPSATSSSSSERISERKQQSEGKKPDASLAGILSPSAKPTQVAVGDDVWVKKPTETHAMEARVLHVYSDNTADIVYTSVPRLGQRERSVLLANISRTKPSSRARRSPSPDRSIFASMDATLGGKKEESGQVEESWEPVEGQAVKAHYREGQPWRLGTIVRVNSDRTVDVRYTDDRVVRGLAFSWCDPGTGERDEEVCQVPLGVALWQTLYRETVKGNSLRTEGSLRIRLGKTAGGLGQLLVSVTLRRAWLAFCLSGNPTLRMTAFNRSSVVQNPKPPQGEKASQGRWRRYLDRRRIDHGPRHQRLAVCSLASRRAKLACPEPCRANPLLNGLERMTPVQGCSLFSEKAKSLMLQEVLCPMF